MEIRAVTGVSLVGLFLMVVILVACDSPARVPSADQQQAAATRELASEANRQIGMPAITNFTEKRLLRQLYDLRDTEGLQTYTYIFDIQGELHHVCDSIGYGMPFSAQFSNPEVVAVNRHQTGVATLPQPEPNGIFLPDSTSATWVICADPDGAFTPMYVEPQIIVSPFPMANVGSYMRGGMGRVEDAE